MILRIHPEIWLDTSTGLRVNFGFHEGRQAVFMLPLGAIQDSLVTDMPDVVARLWAFYNSIPALGCGYDLTQDMRVLQAQQESPDVLADYATPPTDYEAWGQQSSPAPPAPPIPPPTRSRLSRIDESKIRERLIKAGAGEGEAQ